MKARPVTKLPTLPILTLSEEARIFALFSENGACVPDGRQGAEMKGQWADSMDQWQKQLMQLTNDRSAKARKPDLTANHTGWYLIKCLSMPNCVTILTCFDSYHPSSCPCNSHLLLRNNLLFKARSDATSG